jgi:diguanylate cyclase (GGDEF)-like protein
METVCNQLSQWLPQEEPLSSPMEMLTQANRELSRLGFMSQRENQKAKAGIRNARRTIRRLKREALCDPLTGLYNRRFLAEAMLREIAGCVRHSAPVGLMFIDVDGFKPLNDALGHHAGDQVLVRIARTLSGTVRQADVLARYGGEEFIILPMDPSESGLVQLAERLRAAVEQLEIQVEGCLIPVTISVGCTLAVPSRDDHDFGSLLLAAADAAMYDAKRLGGNRAVFRAIQDDGKRGEERV